MKERESQSVDAILPVQSSSCFTEQDDDHEIDPHHRPSVKRFKPDFSDYHYYQQQEDDQDENTHHLVHQDDDDASGHVKQDVSFNFVIKREEDNGEQGEDAADAVGDGKQEDVSGDLR